VLERPRWLPAVFVVCTALLHMAPPFPLVASWSVGYFTLYAPFLFVGAMIYLAEHDMASRAYCAAGIAFVFIAFFQLIPEIHPAWKESTYATYALFLFLVAWRFRDRLVAGPLIRLLSDLTYAVYLFHNWLWQHLQAVVVKIGWIGVSPEIQVFLVLLPVCYVVHRTVEKGGIRLGRLILARYGTRSSEPLSLAPVV
jgi:membrane-bound acyltransferase YfiQ involved in biofilm formation